MDTKEPTESVRSNHSTDSSSCENSPKYNFEEFNQHINNYNIINDAIAYENDIIEKALNDDAANTVSYESDFLEKVLNENDFIRKPLNKYDFVYNETTKNETKCTEKFHKKIIEMVSKANITKDNSMTTKITKTQAKNLNDVKIQKEHPNCLHYDSPEPVAHVELATHILRLKDSTKKLIYLLEEIQSKTHSKYLTRQNDNLAGIMDLNSSAIPSGNVIGDNSAINKLEKHAKALNSIYVEDDDDDDCSVYKRLTRKCLCLNQPAYNDFMIHFNEDSKFFTSNTGEIIKNIRILKKFLYMGGEYSKRALMFLNEGLQTYCKQTEKIEISQGCAHADICDIFEENSIVSFCIFWPWKYENYGDPITQELAVDFLLKLAQVEEGRRYLNYTSKISNDLKKVIRKKTILEENTLESLNALINMLQPPMVEHIRSVTYYCKAVEEGFGFKTLKALINYRKYMTLEEVFIHLDLIHNLSKSDNGKYELGKSLPDIFRLFKNLLIEFDNSEMNIVLTNILNNIISRKILTTPQPQKEVTKTFEMADTATEAIVMKNESNQIPVRKNTRNKNKSKSYQAFGMITSRYRLPSKPKVTPGLNEPVSTPPLKQPFNPIALQKAKRNTKGLRNTVIVVPMEINRVF